MMIVSAVPTHLIDIVWPQCAPLLQRAIDRAHGEFDIDHVRQWVDAQDMQLWVVIVDGAIVASAATEVLQRPNARVLHVTLLGGDMMDQWLEQLDAALSRYAEHIGASALTMIGRKGWLRKLDKMAWTDDHVVMRKDL